MSESFTFAALLSFLTSLGTVAVGLYAAFRMTKTRADLADEPLFKRELETLRHELQETQCELARVIQDRDSWRKLALALTPGIRTAGSQPSDDPSSPG